jgi:signal transduction histidine kinase
MSERFAAQAEQLGLALTAQLPDEPFIIAAGPENISRALENLLDNALKFTPAGGEVQVTLTGSDGWAIFTIRDTGIGILADDLGLIFGRFHRGRNAGEYPGSGLGLAIVQRIVEGYEGEVMALPQEQGTCFVMRLPLDGSVVVSGKKNE